MSWIDLHTHLNMLEATVEETLQLARSADVERVINIGTSPDDLLPVLKTAQDFPEQVSCCLGIHPHEASLFNEEVENTLTNLLDDPHVVGLGEIGLDYYYNHSEQDVQRRVFKRQIEIAIDKGLPIQIHTRDAEKDTIEILEPFKSKITGVFHCYTGSEKMAKQALDLGFDISFSGIITFRNADPLREVLKSTPLDRIHVETDAPFLAPMPKRGKKNTPAYVVHTANLVAQTLGISTEELSDATLKNAKRLFPRLP